MEPALVNKEPRRWRGGGHEPQQTTRIAICKDTFYGHSP